MLFFKIFMQNNVKNFNWLINGTDKTRKTKYLKSSRDSFLKNKNYEIFFKLIDFNKFYADLNEAAGVNRQKWHVINEVRNQRKTQTDIKYLRNFFGVCVTENLKMANLNFNFLDKKTKKCSELANTKNKFFRCARDKYHPSNVTDKECQNALHKIKLSKPQGTLSIPEWATKVAASKLINIYHS